jgi:CheY-like chemotaxis protein
MVSFPSPAIVVVDDAPDVRAILCHLLRHLAVGYDVIAVPDGPTALTQITQRPIALVITDQRLAGMDGVTLTGAIKAAAPQCQVVLLSGCLTRDLERRGRAAGADASLSKPFAYDEFAAVVEAMLTHEAVAPAAMALQVGRL